MCGGLLKKNRLAPGPLVGGAAAKGKNRKHISFCHLTFNALIATAADDIHKYFFIVFQRK